MKNYVILIALIVLGALVISGCQMDYGVVENPTNTSVSNLTLVPVNMSNASSSGAAMEQTTGKVVAPAKDEDYSGLSGVVVQRTEGDLVRLMPEAIDPDNDKVNYYFSKPFDASGKWQTKEGDAGKYPITITASDGKANTTQDITVVILRAKKAPVIECPESVTVKEGDMISLTCNIYDPEGDQAIVEYSGFMKSSTYRATYDDAGNYTTVVSAKNNYKSASKTVKVNILNTDRAPVISFDGGESVQAMENDIVTITPKVSDPDGDKVTVKYSEPFDTTGSWKTKIGDAGTYTASVVASDGVMTAKQDVKVSIKMRNTAPVLKAISDMTVGEGDTVKIPVDVVDREGDKIKVTVKGWMTDVTQKTDYNDAGVYSVTVTASDGQYEAVQSFQVTVLDSNRAPVFKVPA